jgi:type VII secretion integral membrane protein EccD
MSEAFCRITVLAPRRRVDLAVPADLACAELLPQIVRLSGEGDGRPPPVGWTLGRLGEPPLRPERTLAQAGVLDGDTLYLVAGDRRPDPVVVDDLVETIADAVDARRGQWSGPAWHRFLVAAAAVLLAAGAGFAAGRPGPAGAVAAAPRSGPATAAVAVAAVALTVAAAALWRARREGFAAAALALAALPWWAAAAAGLAAATQAAAAPRVAAAAAGLAGGAAAAAVAAPAAVTPALAAAVPAAALAAAAAAVALGATPAQAAAALAVLLPPLAGALPRLAMRLAGIRGGDEDAEVAVDAERAKVAAGHRLLTWLLGGTGVALAGALLVLAFADGAFARPLAAVVVAAVALRARVFRFVAQVLPLGLAALAGLVALEVSLAGAVRSWPARQALGSGLLAATAAALLAAGFLARRRTAAAALRQRLDQLEVAVNLSLLPLAFGVLGLYAAVERYAQRFSG